MARPEVAHPSTPLHWPELCHVTAARCRGQEMQLLLRDVPTLRSGARTFGGQAARLANPGGEPGRGSG